MRFVLIHYHLFKNAGTSVDAILRRNFGAAWENIEFPPQKECDHQQAIAEQIITRPGLRAMSSHTLMLPPPVIEGVEIFPILFLREPIARLRSAYLFERRQGAQTIGSRIAEKNSFYDYFQKLDAMGNRSVRNFQAERLSAALPRALADEEKRAFATLESLPFVGVVEHFDQSMAVLHSMIAAKMPDFTLSSAWENAADLSDPVARKLAGALDEALTPAQLLELQQANLLDTKLFEAARKRYQAG